MRLLGWGVQCLRQILRHKRHFRSSIWLTRYEKGLAMKKSDLKLLQARMQKVLEPPKQKPKQDLSDELSNLFDDGITLEASRPMLPAPEPGDYLSREAEEILPSSEFAARPDPDQDRPRPDQDRPRPDQGRTSPNPEPA